MEVSRFNATPEQIGRYLGLLRERAHLELADTAARVDLEPAVLERIENGTRSASIRELEAIVRAIGTPAAEALLVALDRRWTELDPPDLDHPAQDSLWAAEETLRLLRGLESDPNTRPAFRRRLSAYAGEIKRRARLVDRRHFQLAFIGNIGVGKSTAICRATGLEIAVTGKERKEPILETGGGGITLCEVRVRRGPEYGIWAEPRPEEDLRLDVSDFADLLLGRAGDPGDGEDADAGRPVPREVERVIRNMAGLAVVRRVEQDGTKQRIDPAQLLAEGIPKSELVTEILNRMDLPARQRRDMWWDGASDGEPLVWLNKMFEQINNGRHPEFSMPQRIEIVVPELLEDPDVTVIDTRGIDRSAARADLHAYLSEPHTIAILCSSFNEAPAATIQRLLEREREVGNTYIERNACVLVLPRPSEALAMKDESGQRASTPEDGYDLKEEQVQKALAAQPILFQAPRILFFNSFEEHPDKLREFLSAGVAEVRGRLEADLASVVRQALDALANAESQQALEEQREVARHVSAWLTNHAAPKRPDSAVYNSLLQEMQQTHVSSVRASIRREGTWYSFDYSYQLGFGARRLAHLALDTDVKGFRDHCETFATTAPEAEPLLTQAAELMESAYQDLLRYAQSAGESLYAEELQDDPIFWKALQDEWGRGPGYRQRVTERNRAWFEPRSELESELQQMIQHQWTAVLDRVSAIFELPETGR